MRIAIIGASGYTGLELLRLLGRHPEAEVVAVTSRQHAGRSVEEVFPSLRGHGHLYFSEPDVPVICGHAEWVFTAVPHRAAMSVVPALLEAGLGVVDLSADFRLQNRAVYELWYQPHSAPDLLKDAVYGLPEIYGRRIAEARLVANPGCYPTSALLPLIPLLRGGKIRPEGIVVDSKSGASGAGRLPSVGTLFCEVNEGFRAYKVGKHRHTPEIEQELSLAAERPVIVNFTPHLVPLSRGILTTIYAEAVVGATTAGILDTLGAFYRECPFVRVLPEGMFPDVAWVRGSNFCDIAAWVDGRTGRVILVSAIDNLVKGASGQAVQNLNIMAGLDQGRGLDILPLNP